MTRDNCAEQRGRQICISDQHIQEEDVGKLLGNYPAVNNDNDDRQDWLLLYEYDGRGVFHHCSLFALNMLHLRIYIVFRVLIEQELSSIN